VLGNIIGIFITPLWLSHFLDVQGAAPYADVLIELTYTIIGPLIVGQLMQFFTPKVVRTAAAAVAPGRVASSGADSNDDVDESSLRALACVVNQAYSMN
jgi:sodium/bile acid cotransporter 7